MRVLSIDFGTSNTVAVLAAPGTPPRVVDIDGASVLPSAVFAADGELVVGREAERRARTRPELFEPNPKRRVDDGTLLFGATEVPVTDTFAAVLGRVRGEVDRQLGGASLDQVRLTHPAGWGLARRTVLRDGALAAGLGADPVLVPEPVAAAAHFTASGHQLSPGDALAVYDLGAGTLDIAVVRRTATGFEVLDAGGLTDFGGVDIDQALLDYVGMRVSNQDPARWQQLMRPESTAQRRAARALRVDVIAAKEALSHHAHTEVALPEPFADVLITRDELDGLIGPALSRSVDLLASTIRAAGRTPQDLAGVYLVGGSSRIPLVAAMIARRLGVVPVTLDQPETTVALGAHRVDLPAPAASTPPAVTPPATTPPATTPPATAAPSAAPPTSTAPAAVPAGPQPNPAEPRDQSRTIAVAPPTAPHPVAQTVPEADEPTVTIPASVIDSAGRSRVGVQASVLLLAAAVLVAVVLQILLLTAVVPYASSPRNLLGVIAASLAIVLDVVGAVMVVRRRAVPVGQALLTVAFGLTLGATGVASGLNTGHRQTIAVAVLALVAAAVAHLPTLLAPDRRPDGPGRPGLVNLALLVTGAFDLTTLWVPSVVLGCVLLVCAALAATVPVAVRRYAWWTALAALVAALPVLLTHTSGSEKHLWLYRAAGIPELYTLDWALGAALLPAAACAVLLFTRLGLRARTAAHRDPVSP